MPVKGDHRYHGYAVVEARLRALNNHDRDKLDGIYSADAAILDAETNATELAGLAAIKAQYAQLLATCAHIALDVVEREYSDHGRIVTDRERARCGAATVYERWFKYEIDVDRYQIMRVWEEPHGNEG